AGPLLSRALARTRDLAWRRRRGLELLLDALTAAAGEALKAPPGRPLLSPTAITRLAPRATCAGSNHHERRPRCDLRAPADAVRSVPCAPRGGHAHRLCPRARVRRRLHARPPRRRRHHQGR